MTLIRVLAILILIFGVAATFTGIGGLTIIESSISIMQQMHDAGSTTLEGIDIASMRLVLYVTYALTSLIGMLSIVSGVGILFRKNWARLLWIATLILMFAWMSYSFAMSSINRGLAVGSFLTNVVILLVLGALVYFFSREKTKSYFEVK